MKYLFNYWKDLQDKFVNKNIMLFLDYDGTLAPIVKNPDKAFIPGGTRKLLQEFSKLSQYRLAIISGRMLKSVKNMVRLRGIIYAGNHGLEIEGPKIKFRSPVSLAYKTLLKKIKDDLQKKLAGIKGALIEDKGLTLSLHYRAVNKKDIPLVKTIFHEAVIVYLIANKIKVRSGKMVLEIRPPVNWDKGKVALWFLARERFKQQASDILPVYIGDDITDEDAFRDLRNRGLTIFVGKPKDSFAQYYLKNTRQVAKFLESILRLKRQ
jgi:trehalose-phosphatase